jgi:hypothetical protein
VPVGGRLAVGQTPACASIWHGHVERGGERLQDPDGRLVVAALELAEVGVGQLRERRELTQGQVRLPALGADVLAEHVELGLPHGSAPPGRGR